MELDQELALGLIRDGDDSDNDGTGDGMMEENQSGDDLQPQPRDSTGSARESEGMTRYRTQRRDRSYIGMMVEAEREWLDRDRVNREKQQEFNSRLELLFDGLQYTLHQIIQEQRERGAREERRLALEERKLQLHELRLRMKRRMMERRCSMCLSFVTNTLDWNRSDEEREEEEEEEEREMQGEERREDNNGDSHEAMV